MALDDKNVTYEIDMPAILSLTRNMGYKLPYVKRENIYKDVKSLLSILTAEDLGLQENEIGLKGSLTKVANTYVKEYQTKDRIFVKADEHGVEIVFNYLIDKGLL